MFNSKNLKNISHLGNSVIIWGAIHIFRSNDAKDLYKVVRSNVVRSNDELLSSNLTS